MFWSTQKLNNIQGLVYKMRKFVLTTVTPYIKSLCWTNAFLKIPIDVSKRFLKHALIHFSSNSFHLTGTHCILFYVFSKDHCCMPTWTIQWKNVQFTIINEPSILFQACYYSVLCRPNAAPISDSLGIGRTLQPRQ